jgi:hypothetical protein
MGFAPIKNASVADDPQMLARYVENLGGQIVEHRTFRFEIPLSETRRIIPELNGLGLRCEKVGERQCSDVNNRAISVALIELRRQPQEESSYSAERSLMARIIQRRGASTIPANSASGCARTASTGCQNRRARSLSSFSKTAHRLRHGATRCRSGDAVALFIRKVLCAAGAPPRCTAASRRRAACKRCQKTKPHNYGTRYALGVSLH